MNHTIRLTALDGLRGLAALGVAIFWHYQHFQPEIYPFSRKAYWFYQYGFSLVDLFFVLSGFVFSYVYKDKLSDRSIGIKEFSILRLSRLYPLHFLTLILVLIIQAARSTTGHDYFVYQLNDSYHFLLNLLFIQNGWVELGYSFNAPTWSVSVELIAYFLFFWFVYVLGKGRKMITVFLAVIILGFLLNVYQVNLPMLNQQTDRVFLAFFVGCITYEIHKYMMNVKQTKIFTLITLVIFSIVVGSSIILGHKVLGEDWPTVYTMAVFPMGIILVLNSKLLNVLFSLQPFKYLGDISYSIYLVHFPVQLIIRTMDDVLNLNINYSSRVFFILFVLIVILLSVISYEFFEKPVQKYLRTKFINKEGKESPDKKIETVT